jgi:lipoprotein-anchoring transpeptidase ErfK/SrfK
MRGWGWTALVLVLLASVPGIAAAKRLEAVRLQGLALMAEPRDGGNMLRALKAGEQVTVVARKGPWVEVTLADGTRGFVHGGFLTGFPEVVPIAAYAGRIDQTVTRPAQTEGGERATALPETAPEKPAKPLAPAKTAKLSDRPAYAPVADGGGLDGFLACLVQPPRAGQTAKTNTALEAFQAHKNRYFIEVHLAERKLYLYENLPDGSHHLVRTYVVAVPSKDKEVPQGWGVVTGISFEPWWYPTASIKAEAKKNGHPLPDFIKPGVKANPMGEFKIILSHGDGFRIHGNNNPSSIGRSVTHGCIRMRNDEGKGMAKMIDVGTEVVFSQ